MEQFGDIKMARERVLLGNVLIYTVVRKMYTWKESLFKVLRSCQNKHLFLLQGCCELFK